MCKLCTQLLTVYPFPNQSDTNDLNEHKAS